MMAERVVVFGAGDFARIAAHYLDVDSPHEVVAFTVHERHLPQPATLRGRQVVPFERLEISHPPGEYAVFVAIGFSRERDRDPLTFASLHQAYASRNVQNWAFATSRNAWSASPGRHTIGATAT
jgi:hypothetical protein